MTPSITRQPSPEAERITELEAENAGWKRSHAVWCDDLANIDDLKKRAEQAEAELAAMNARRCGTCSRRTDERAPERCYIYDEVGDDDYFSCNSWAEREGA